MANRVFLFSGSHRFPDLRDDLAMIDAHQLEELLDVEQAQIVLSEMNRKQRFALRECFLPKLDQDPSKAHAGQI